MTSAAKALPAVLERIDADLDKSLDRLFDLVRIPSISTDSAYKDFCRAAADHVAKDLASLGFETAVRPTAGHPVVTAKSNGATAPNSGPRVLFYGHYDVQPVDPLNLWNTPPFEPKIDTLPDGRKIIHGRGACDDKGQLMTFVEACRAFKAVTGKLPLDITMMIEGEEECGSKSLFDFVRTQCRRVQARSRAGLRHRHVGPEDAGRHDIAARPALRGSRHHLRGSRPAFRRVRRRRRQSDPRARAHHRGAARRERPRHGAGIL